MANTAHFAATTGVNVGAIQTLADGVSTTLYCIGRLDKGETIPIQIPNDGETIWETLRHVDEGGKEVQVKFSEYRNCIKLTGPLDWRWNKGLTDNAIEIGYYS